MGVSHFFIGYDGGSQFLEGFDGGVSHFFGV